MKQRLFIYYRIPKPQIALALTCAKQLMLKIVNEGLGTGEFFQREEVGKPYFTLMEVIQPNPKNPLSIEGLSVQVECLAKECFSAIESLPIRHIELFNRVD